MTKKVNTLYFEKIKVIYSIMHLMILKFNDLIRLNYADLNNENRSYYWLWYLISSKIFLYKYIICLNRQI